MTRFFEYYLAQNRKKYIQSKLVNPENAVPKNLCPDCEYPQSVTKIVRLARRGGGGLGGWGGILGIFEQV